MTRPLRIDYAGAAQHVMSRGIEGRRICVDDLDRNHWLKLLGRTAERCGWQVFAFSLLDNHYHLLLRTPEGQLAAGMHQLNSDYAGYFNRRHQRRGPLMQGRYKSVLVENAGHWSELSRYIHLNPVRAGLCQRPEAWRWSSYPGYHRPSLRPAWVDCRTVLEEFGKHEGDARRAYREFMEDGLGRRLDNPVSKAAHGLVLGSDDFVSNVRRMLAGRGAPAEVSALRCLRREVDLRVVVERLARRLGADPSKWQPGRRIDDLARARCAYALRQGTGARHRELATVLGYRSASSVGAACRLALKTAHSEQAKIELETLVDLVSHYSLFEA